jgi:DNA-binding transcriptional LysR family regulator
MDPRRLLTFRVVAHERSFSRAAERLSRSQPSVSSQIALLETEVGVRLFDRARRGLRLTAAGEVLLDHADHIAWRLELADTQIAALAGEQHGQVRLGCFPTAMGGLAAAAISQLRSAHGDIRVLVDEVTADMLEPRLLSGQFDIALGYQDSTLPRRDFPGAERIELAQETFLVGLPVGHPLAGGSGPLALAELAGEDWVMASTSGFLADACREAGFEPHVVALCREPVGTHGIIARGIGIGFIPSLLAQAHPDIVVRPIEGPIRHRDIFVVLPPGERHPHARHVLAALQTAAEEFHHQVER